VNPPKLHYKAFFFYIFIGYKKLSSMTTIIDFSFDGCLYLPISRWYLPPVRDSRLHPSLQFTYQHSTMEEDTTSPIYFSWHISCYLEYLEMSIFSYCKVTYFPIVTILDTTKHVLFSGTGFFCEKENYLIGTQFSQIIFTLSELKSPFSRGSRTDNAYYRYWFTLKSGWQ
jgi:hypothetical protein